MENQTANWKALGMDGDCLQTEVDGWDIEASRDGEKFWVVGEEGDIDTFAWCDYMEGYELELANGVTDSIPTETWERIEEAIGRLREEWREKNQIGDIRKRRFVDWHKGSFYELIEEWDGVEWKEKTSETVYETDECA